MGLFFIVGVSVLYFMLLLLCSFIVGVSVLYLMFLLSVFYYRSKCVVLHATAVDALLS